MLAVPQPVWAAASLSAPLGGAPRHTKTLSLLEHCFFSLPVGEDSNVCRRQGWGRRAASSQLGGRRHMHRVKPSARFRIAGVQRSICACTEKKMHERTHAVHNAMKILFCCNFRCKSDANRSSLGAPKEIAALSLSLHCSGALHQKFRKESERVNAASGQHLPKMNAEKRK